MIFTKKTKTNSSNCVAYLHSKITEETIRAEQRRITPEATKVTS
jgi:hypothetical protein